MTNEPDDLTDEVPDDNADEAIVLIDGHGREDYTTDTGVVVSNFFFENGTGLKAWTSDGVTYTTRNIGIDGKADFKSTTEGMTAAEVNLHIAFRASGSSDEAPEEVVAP